MRVFVTGATGFVGSAVVGELIGQAIKFSASPRSDDSAALVAAGAQAYRGSLEDLDGCSAGRRHRTPSSTPPSFTISRIFRLRPKRTGARSRLARRSACAINRPLLVTSGTALVSPGRVATEDDLPDPSLTVAWPRRSEEKALETVSLGVAASAVRLPPSRCTASEIMGSSLISSVSPAKRGVSAYVGDGLNRWPAITVSTPHVFLGSRWRKASPEHVITRSATRVCRFERSPASSDAA